MIKKLNGVFLIFFVICTICFAKLNGDYLHQITTKYITEHLNWAKPLEKGKIKCLFLVPRHGAREVVELWQRMDIEFESFTAWWQGQIAVEDMYEGAIEGTTNKEKNTEIISKLEKDYDVIIVSIGFDVLPAEAKYKIFEKAYKGTGIVFLNPNNSIDRVYKKVFVEKIDASDAFLNTPAEGIPSLGNNFFRGYKYGNGRILIMKGGAQGAWSGYYGGTSLTVPEKYSRFWKSHYENNMVAIAKAVMWASKREPVFSMRNANFKNGDKFIQTELPKELKFGITGDKNKIVNVNLRLRDEWNEMIDEKTIKTKIEEGEKQISYNLPFLKQGNFYLDFIIYNEKKNIENFGFFTFSVDSTIGKVNIATEKDWYDKGEKIKGVVELENTLKEKGEIIIKIVDSPNKKIWVKKSYLIEPEQKNLNFEIDFGKFPALYGFIEAEIIQNNRVLVKSEKGISFPDREMPLYPSFVWSFNETPYPEFYLPQLTKAGFDALQANPEISAMFNLKTWPMLTRIFLFVNRNAPQEKKGWMQFVGIDKALPKFEDEIKKIDPNLDSKKIIEIGDFSYYNPVIRKIYGLNLKKQVKNYFPAYPTLYYNLGDENSYTIEGGYSPGENAEFIKFLEKKYKKIENLNKEWEEDFKSFEDVKHYFVEDMRKGKKYVAYCDHVKFVSKEYADAHLDAAEAIKEVDPYAYVGAEGSPSGDIEYILSKLDVWGPYSDTIENELLRCFGKNKLRTIWWGGYVGTHGGRNEVPTPLWNYLLSGIVNGNSFFMAGPWNEGFLSVDLSYARYFESMFPHLKKLEDGIAPLLIINELKNYGIAVYYSFTSQILSGFGENKFLPLSSSCSPLIQFCYRNGFNFDFLNSEMLKNGKLNDYKILFLFGSSSIHPEDKKKIEEFIKKGGIVIADINPGICNENGKLLDKSQFSEILGFDLKPAEDFTLKNVEIDREIKGKSIKLKVNNVSAASGLDPFIVKQYGNGFFILLNFNLSSVFNSSPSISDFDNFLLDILSICGIKKQVNIENFTGTIARIALRKGDDFEILGALLYYGKVGDRITLKLNQDNEKYIYRVDEGFLKQGNEIQDTLSTSPSFLLYSIFDQKQEKPEIKVENNTINAGEKINVNFVSKKENRIYRIRLLKENSEIYQKIIQSNQTSFQIPVAYNETPGNYLLELTDVLTGLKERVNILVRGQK